MCHFEILESKKLHVSRMKISKGKKIAVVWGAETKLGQRLVEQLLFHSAYLEVKIFVEKKLTIESSKLTQVLIKTENLKDTLVSFGGHDLFLCKVMEYNQSKSKKELFKSNLLMPLEFAKMAKAGKVNQVFCLSSLGANEESPFFNQRVLGSLENHLKKMDFWAVHFFRPSFFNDKKNSNPFGNQIIKKLGNFFNDLTGGKLDSIKPVAPKIIAKSMVLAAQELKKGIHYHKNSEFLKLEEKDEDFA